MERWVGVTASGVAQQPGRVTWITDPPVPPAGVASACGGFWAEVPVAHTAPAGWAGSAEPPKLPFSAEILGSSSEAAATALPPCAAQSSGWAGELC